MWGSNDQPLPNASSLTSRADSQSSVDGGAGSPSMQPTIGEDRVNGSGAYNAARQMQNGLDAEDAETCTFENVMRRSSGNERLTLKPELVNTWMRAKSLHSLNPERNMGQSAFNRPIHRGTAVASGFDGHHRSASRAQDLLQHITKFEDDRVMPVQHQSFLLSQADHIEESATGLGRLSKNFGRDETLPLVQSQDRQYGAVAHPSLQARQRKTDIGRLSLSDRCRTVLRNACDPFNAGRAVWHSYATWIGVPLTASAWFLFYYLGNPELEFLPGTVTLEWWLTFTTRQMIALDVARFAPWLLLDCLILGSKTIARVVGPVTCLYCDQAKGWPVVAIVWALFDLVFLYGDSELCTHWLYWTNLRIYSLAQANSGTYIIKSNMYLRVLLAMLLAGFATTIKRFWLSFQLSRRQCIEFKPRLEKILAEIILVTELACFAAEIQGRPSLSDAAMPSQTKKSSSNTLQGLQSIGFEISRGSSASEEDDDAVTEVAHTSDSTAPKTLKSTEQQSTAPTHFDVPKSKDISSSDVTARRLRYKNIMDSWESPLGQNDKAEVSIRDVLLFQAALMYMNDAKPFGDAFGSATTRDECIQSSIHVFTNLQTLDTSTHPAMDFDVLALATCNVRGCVDMDKKRMLRRLFRPDARNRLTELGFVQSCESIFKRLCYFRASVGNSSVIDKVLASIANGCYNFLLVLILLSLLRFNPWALMVSLTSLLVSVSFALGSSISRYVEGILLIAVTRPYDLGDRIYIGTSDTIASGSGSSVDVSSHTWFVEDITLTTTTLPFCSNQ